jgi:hypothetical protein
MDDFYIYYEPIPQGNMAGVIKAISPTKLVEMKDKEFIRVSSEIGLSFSTGAEPLNGWAVVWDSGKSAMSMVKQDNSFTTNATFNYLEAIPSQQTKAQVIVTQKQEKNVFNVRTRGVSISHRNIKMAFFITRLDDPNILYYHFQVPLYDTMNRKGVDFKYDVELPERFSVYTKQELERYQLRIE